MNDRPLNHFGSFCHGDSPNTLKFGHPLVFVKDFYNEGEVGDLLDGAGEISMHIPPEESVHLESTLTDSTDDYPSDGPEEPDDDIAQDYIRGYCKTPWFIPPPMLLNEESGLGYDNPSDSDEECYCSPSLQCGCNHTKRGHWRTRFTESRHGKGDYRRLARQHRQSIRYLSQD